VERAAALCQVGDWGRRVGPAEAQAPARMQTIGPAIEPPREGAES
jgi:hypothetical protein